MLTYSYENRWRWFLLFGVSLISTFYSWFFIHEHATAVLPLMLAHALLIPLALSWTLQGIILCQPNATLLIATVASLHPFYLSKSSSGASELIGLVTFLLFLGLALHTFNFSWVQLPRHVIENTLFYAPEWGFVCSQYDILIDEIGYNSWYAAYRLQWLILIGLCWGVLLLLSPWSLLFGFVLTLFYFFLSSTYTKGLIKIASLYLPALAVFGIHAYFTKSTILFYPSFALPKMATLFQQMILLTFPSLSIWQKLTIPWYKQLIMIHSITLDFFCLIGFVGTCFMLCKKNYALSQTIKVIPFYIITLFAFLYDAQTPLFWMNHSLLLLLGLLFWHEQARKIWPNFFSE
jgi:hypothetical protein